MLGISGLGLSFGNSANQNSYGAYRVTRRMAPSMNSPASGITSAAPTAAANANTPAPVVSATSGSAAAAQNAAPMANSAAPMSQSAAPAAATAQPSLPAVQLPFMREGVDPAEFAVRRRIVYVGGQGQGEGQPMSGAQKMAGAAGLLHNAPAASARGTAANGPWDSSFDPSSVQGAGSAQKAFDDGQCRTCQERKYQDGSDDPGVSFKAPTNIAPEQAASAVRGHEQEHVVRNQAKAQREGRKVVSQSVVLHTAICPECGKSYISGGTTTTVTKNAGSNSAVQQQNQQPADKTQGITA